MRHLRLVSWGMLAVWASWLTAAQAVAVSRSFLGAWTPDLSLLLLFSCASRLHRRDVVSAALVIALARIAYSVDSPAALLAGYLAAAVTVGSVRRIADLERPLFACILAGLLELLLGAWLVLVHALRSAEPVARSLADSAPALLAGSAATAVAALLAGGLVLLPGLTPLRTRRW